MSFQVNFTQTPNQSLVTNQSCGCNCTYQVPQSQKIVNAYDVAKKFCNLYYPTMSQGVSGVLNLFDQNAFCNYGGRECVGMYNVMIMMTTDGISRMNYDKLTASVIPINNNQFSLQLIGLCQGVTFWGQLTTVREFSETFVLSMIDDKIVTTSYCFRLI